MARLIPVFVLAVLATAFLSVDAQDAKKKQRDLSTFTGKITDVNIDERTKKLESIYVQATTKLNRNVRINEKTMFEFVGFPDKDSEMPRKGDTASGKIDPATDYATHVRITYSGPKVDPKKVDPKKKADPKKDAK